MIGRGVAGASALVAAVSLVGCAGTQGGSGSGGKQPTAEAGWRDEFPVKKTELGTSGTGRYWRLEPGRAMEYRSADGATLRIGVTDQTREVDGVTTRIVEEREAERGALVEVSRNFFAMDAASGDVYYFGEEVDMYRGGQIVGHGGAWLAGIDGARFGLGLPGTPRVGDRYYQEVAPGVAMDRGEVVSVDERVVTPAGVFEHCVHVRETTPLERDTSHKWYAPGIGLIKDDEMELVGMTR